MPTLLLRPGCALAKWPADGSPKRRPHAEPSVAFRARNPSGCRDDQVFPGGTNVAYERAMDRWHGRPEVRRHHWSRRPRGGQHRPRAGEGRVSTDWTKRLLILPCSAAKAEAERTEKEREEVVL